jgi:hypothetical protein
MKRVMLFEQFVAESRQLNEATGADLLSLLDDALSGGVEFQTVYDMKKEDQRPSRQLKAAAKKIDARNDDNVAVIYSSQTDDWDTVLKTAKKWGGKFIEIEDEDGSAIVFPMVESYSLNESKAAVEKAKEYLNDASLTELTGSEWNSNAVDITEPSLIWWVGPKKNKVTLQIKPSSWDSSYLLVSLMGVSRKDSTSGSNELVIFEKGFRDIKSLVSEFRKEFGISLNIDPRFERDYKNWLNDMKDTDSGDSGELSSKAKEQLARMNADYARARETLRNRGIRTINPLTGKYD